MKILITGSNGFVAKNLKQHFASEDITEISRNVLDIRDRDAFDTFMSTRTFDVILHTAMVGGRRYETPNGVTLLDNTVMFYNILRHRKKFNKIINFGSGAELDRLTPLPGDEQFPIDPYGLSKNIIYRIGSTFDNFYNLRIYNVFGPHEPLDRMILFNIYNYVKHEPINIHQDKLMDFFYIKDLMTVIERCITSNECRDIDCVYKEKFKLSDIANIINELDNHKVQINIPQSSLTNSYIGNSNALDSFNLDLIGLRRGIRELYNEILLDKAFI